MKWLTVFIIVSATVLADLFQSIEMKRQAVTIEELRPGRFGGVLARLARRRFLIFAVALMGISFFAFLNLLSIPDLSFAVPITAASRVRDDSRQVGPRRIRVATALDRCFLGGLRSGVAGGMIGMRLINSREDRHVRLLFERNTDRNANLH